MGSLPVLPTTLGRVCVASILEITFQPAGPRICMRGALFSKPGVLQAILTVVLVPLSPAPFPYEMGRY